MTMQGLLLNSLLRSRYHRPQLSSFSDCSSCCFYYDSRQIRGYSARYLHRRSFWGTNHSLGLFDWSSFLMRFRACLHRYSLDANMQKTFRQLRWSATLSPLHVLRGALANLEITSSTLLVLRGITLVLHVRPWFILCNLKDSRHSAACTERNP